MRALGTSTLFAGPAGRQLGSLARDAWLLLLELCDVAAGIDEVTIRDLKSIDRMVLPPEHHGVFLKGGDDVGCQEEELERGGERRDHLRLLGNQEANDE